MVHALEHAEDPRETLKEMWRVLAPNGRLVIVVPNRRGLWASFEHTPFGSGRPYSRGQLIASFERGELHARTVGRSSVLPAVDRDSDDAAFLICWSG